MSDKREKVAQWMISRGYATGHGDTIKDLLKELEWQVAEKKGKDMSKKALDELGVAIANAGYEWTPEMRKSYEQGIRESEWVGLTDEEMKDALVSVDAETKRLPPGFRNFARAVEAKLKEKNT